MTAAATGIVQETTSADDGGFQFMQLAAGEWEIEVSANGYVGILSGVTIRRLSENRRLSIELVAAPPGGLFREGLAFEAEGGTRVLSSRAMARSNSKTRRMRERGPTVSST